MSLPKSLDETTTYVPAKSLDSLHHVAISVQNIAESVAWYTSHFHCKIAYQTQPGAADIANTQLALVIPEQHPPHLAFTHPEAANFGPLKTHRDGLRSTYIIDPSGNSVEIMAK